MGGAYVTTLIFALFRQHKFFAHFSHDMLFCHFLAYTPSRPPGGIFEPGSEKQVGGRSPRGVYTVSPWGEFLDPRGKAFWGQGFWPPGVIPSLPGGDLYHPYEQRYPEPNWRHEERETSSGHHWRYAEQQRTSPAVGTSGGILDNSLTTTRASTDCNRSRRRHISNG